MCAYNTKKTDKCGHITRASRCTSVLKSHIMRSRPVVPLGAVCSTAGCTNAATTTCYESDSPCASSTADSCSDEDEDDSVCSGSGHEDEGVVKDLEYWKAEAEKTERVANTLCVWYRAKSDALVDLKCSSADKLQFTENELARYIASSSEKEKLVANEMERERVSTRVLLQESRDECNTAILAGKRSRLIITGLLDDIEEMEVNATDLAAYHAEFSTHKRRKRGSGETKN
jgi:hypothetical protein